MMECQCCEEFKSELSVLQEEYDEFVVLSKENDDELTTRAQEFEKSLEARDRELHAAKSKIKELTESMGASLDELGTLRLKVTTLTSEKQRLETGEEKAEAVLRASEATCAQSAELLEAAQEDAVLLTTELQEARLAQRESEARWRREESELKDQIAVLSSSASSSSSTMTTTTAAEAATVAAAALGAAAAAAARGGVKHQQQQQQTQPIGGGGLTARLLNAFSDLQETSARIQKLEHDSGTASITSFTSSSSSSSSTAAPSSPLQRTPQKSSPNGGQQDQENQEKPASRDYDTLFPSPRRRSGKLNLLSSPAAQQPSLSSPAAAGGEGGSGTGGGKRGRWSTNSSGDGNGGNGGNDAEMFFGTAKFRPTPLPVGGENIINNNSSGVGGDAAPLLQHAPPAGEAVKMLITDRYGEYRGFISKEGACVSNTGAPLGFVNFEERTAGSCSEELLGCARDQLSGDEVVVEDATSREEAVGSLNLGSGVVKNSVGNTVGELKRDGVVMGVDGSHLGSFSPFTFEDARVVALYVMLLDPGMLSRREENEEAGAGEE